MIAGQTDLPFVVGSSTYSPGSPRRLRAPGQAGPWRSNRKHRRDGSRSVFHASLPVAAASVVVPGALLLDLLALPG